MRRIFVSPVGYLTSHMMTEDEMNTTGISVGKAEILAQNIFLLSGTFWIVCALFWVAMAVTLPRKRSDVSRVGGRDFEQNTLV